MKRMLDRRDLLIGMGCAALLPRLAAGGERPAPTSLTRPIAFNTPEADRITQALEVFPADNPWNEDVSAWPLHPNSRQIVASVGVDKPFRANPDMGFILVPPDQKRVDVKVVTYPDESDRGPFPIPDAMPIEGWPASFARDPRLRGATLDDVQRDRMKLGGDRHAIVVDPTARMLYEFYGARRTDAGWEARQASVFDLKSNTLRPDGWTSTDAAGLPIFPAVVRHDELVRGEIRHALRVTVRRSRRAYVYPATHFASRSVDRDLPRMGERFRLRRDFKTARFSPPVRTILEALKRHGMFVADNGIEWAISVAPDERIAPLHAELRKVSGGDFEAVRRPT